MCLQQCQVFVYGGEYVQCQIVYFYQFGGIQIVFVLLDYGVFGYGCVFYWYECGQWMFGDYKVVGMLGQMVGEIDQFGGQCYYLLYQWCVWVEIVFVQCVGQWFVVVLVVQVGGQFVDLVWWQVECVGYIVYGVVFVVVDCYGGQCGVFVVVVVEYVLQYFFVVFVFEIDVDVWWFVVFGGNEVFEQQFYVVGIDFGDVQYVVY